MLLAMVVVVLMKLASVEMVAEESKARQGKGLGAQTRGRRVRRGSYKDAMRLGE